MTQYISFTVSPIVRFGKVLLLVFLDNFSMKSYNFFFVAEVISILWVIKTDFRPFKNQAYLFADGLANLIPFLDMECTNMLSTLLLLYSEPV